MKLYGYSSEVYTQYQNYKKCLMLQIDGIGIRTYNYNMRYKVGNNCAQLN